MFIRFSNAKEATLPQVMISCQVKTRKSRKRRSRLFSSSKGQVPKIQEPVLRKRAVVGAVLVDSCL
jgi:hypothetical protein